MSWFKLLDKLYICLSPNIKILVNCVTTLYAKNDM